MKYEIKSLAEVPARRGTGRNAALRNLRPGEVIVDSCAKAERSKTLQAWHNASKSLRRPVRAWSDDEHVYVCLREQADE